MKTAKVLALSLVSAFVLTACGATKIGVDEFNNIFQNMEEHTYSTAVLKYSIDAKGTGYFEDYTQKKSAKHEYKYLDGAWTSEENSAEAEELMHYLYSAAGTTFQEQDLEQDDVSYHSYFYKNPLKYVTKTKSTMQSMKFTIEITYQFDKYGYITKYVSKSNGNIDIETVKGRVNSTETISISYKD